MKKLLCIFLLCCLMFVTACSEETQPIVVTYDQSTTQKTSATEPTMEEPTESESTEAHTASPTVVAPKYEVCYSSVWVQRDSVGNAWLNVIAEVKNVSDEPLSLTQGTILVFANEEHVLTLEDAVCYPRVLEPGQIGYYFEQSQAYVQEDAQLRVEIESNVERANDLALYVDESSQIYDSAYGVEVRGTFPADIEAEGILCVAVILYDTEQKPFAVLYDYIDSETNEFTLSSDKLPEGLRKEDISSHIVYVYPYGG